MCERTLSQRPGTGGQSESMVTKRTIEMTLSELSSIIIRYPRCVIEVFAKVAITVPSTRVHTSSGMAASTIQVSMNASIALGELRDAGRRGILKPRGGGLMFIYRLYLFLL